MSEDTFHDGENAKASPLRMTAPTEPGNQAQNGRGELASHPSTIHQLLAEVLHKERRFEELIGPKPAAKDYQAADALLASPELKAIIDLAAWWTDVSTQYEIEVPVSEPALPGPVYALLFDWRANR